MVLRDEHKVKILEAVEKAAKSIDYGEVRVKLNKSEPKMEIVIETQERLRFDKEFSKPW